MKRFLLVIALFAFYTCFSQEDAWVYFTDKPQSQYYLDNPLEMLTQKALDRRTVQGIALDVLDVPVHQPYIDALVATPGITVMAKSKWMNCVHVRGSTEDISNLGILDFVESIDFADNSLGTSGRPGRERRPSAIAKTFETAADFSYGNSSSQIQMLNGHLLHQQDFTGEGVTIAVLDNGFPGVNNTQPFQRLSANNLILGGYNFVQRSDNVYTGGTHGTLVLSTMGGYAEGQLVGTAPDAFYYLFVTEDTADENPVEESYWVEAAEMADSLGVDVINTSLGYFVYSDPAYSYTYEDLDGQTTFITRGSNAAFSRGMLCITSAGNSATSANPHITAPGDAPNTLTVGAVNENEEYASFSSIGPTFDQRVKPDVMARGLASVVATAEGGIGASNGTSFSSPITAGLVACLWQALPGKTNAEILQLVRQSADRFANSNAQYGYGIPDFALALSNALKVTDVVKSAFLPYPNPSSGIVTFMLPEGQGDILVVLYNNLGQNVFNSVITTDKPNISLESLPQGIYSYKLQDGQQMQSGRIIKQ